MAEIRFETAELRDLVKEIVSEVLEGIEQRRFWPKQLTFSEAEAADLLGISRRRLQDHRLVLENEGEMVSRRFGRQVRYSREDLLRLAGMKMSDVAS